MCVMIKESVLRIRNCVFCYGKVSFEIIDDNVSYKKYSIKCKTLGWWCLNCDEVILEGSGLKMREEVFLKLKNSIDILCG